MKDLKSRRRQQDPLRIRQRYSRILQIFFLKQRLFRSPEGMESFERRFTILRGSLRRARKGTCCALLTIDHAQGVFVPGPMLSEALKSAVSLI